MSDIPARLYAAVGGMSIGGLGVMLESRVMLGDPWWWAGVVLLLLVVGATHDTIKNGVDGE